MEIMTTNTVTFLNEFVLNNCTVLQQYKMARGHQKIQSQQKNAEKQSKMKKAQGTDQKKAAQAALVYVCAVCKACASYLLPVACLYFCCHCIISSTMQVTFLSVQSVTNIIQRVLDENGFFV